MLTTDQVATAPRTDPIQARFAPLRQSRTEAYRLDLGARLL